MKSHSPFRISSGFTLLEMLVSVSVLVMLIVIVMQITSVMSRTVNAASQQLDLAAQSRTVLDRIGNDVSSMLVAEGIAPIVIKNSGDAASGPSNDGFALLTNARPRDRSASGIGSNDIRMAAMGYRVVATQDPLSSGAMKPTLSWGDGTITWSPQNTTQIKSDLTKATSAIASDLRSTGSSQTMIDFQPLGQGIFRLEICFLLDDGTIVSEPPRDVNFAGVTANTYAVALSKTSSTDPNKRYVKAFIVGIAGLDTKTLQLVGAKGGTLQGLADTLPDPVATNQTPLQAWDFTSSKSGATALRAALADHYPLPVLNSLRLFQRYYYIDNVQL